MQSPVCPAIFAGLVFMASCGAGDQAGTDARSAGAAVAESTLPFEGTARIVDRPRPGAEVATLVGVRTGRHPGFGRVVFEFAADGLPGCRVEYLGEPARQCGSGEVVPVAGKAWLRVRFTPARAHDEEGRPTVAARSQAPGLPLLEEIVELTCDFEGVVTWVLGLALPERFRVLELENPPRVVVDVRH